MLLSIVTINRNNAAGLRKTIDSVVSQTFKDFEYIVIDGASTDESVEIIESYSDNITYWLSEPDTGIYNAMNKGIMRAKGEYVLFLNSGDFLLDDNTIANVFACHCVADILCARCNVSDNGQIVWTSNPPDKVTFGTLYYVGLAHQSTFISRTLFDKYGYYDESFRYNADIEFWYRTIIDHNASTQKIDIITTDYNLDGISTTQSATKQYQDEMQKIFSNPLYQHFIPDYNQWIEERSKYDSLSWILNRPILMKMLDLYRRILKHI